MKGGGVKGRAIAGAAQVLQQYIDFDVYVGTSAGAIAAVLMAGGNTAGELIGVLEKKNFSTFLDGFLLFNVLRFPFRKGLYTGDPIEDWIDQQLNFRANRAAGVEMGNLNSRAVVYASGGSSGLIEFDRDGGNKEVPAAFAVRCSMGVGIKTS